MMLAIVDCAVRIPNNPLTLLNLRSGVATVPAAADGTSGARWKLLINFQRRVRRQESDDQASAMNLDRASRANPPAKHVSAILD